MSSPARRERPMVAELFDWLEGGFPPAFRPFTGNVLRVEDYVEDGRYVVKVELPGVDPDKDVEVTVHDGILVVKAERREEKKEGQRSEFRYGTFTRTVSLPAGTDENDITATYANGILEIRVGMKADQGKEPKKIQVSTG